MVLVSLSRRWMHTHASARVDGEARSALWTWISARAVLAIMVGSAMTHVPGRQARLRLSLRCLRVKQVTMCARHSECICAVTAVFNTCDWFRLTAMRVAVELGTKVGRASWT